MSDGNNTPDNNAASSGDGGVLSVKKQAFALAYHAEPNATKAAIRAGYSAKTAQQAGSRLLKDPGVKAELVRLAEQAAEAPAPKGSAKPKPITTAPAAKAAPPAKVSDQLLARAGAADPEQPQLATTPMEEAFITEYLRNGMNGTAAWIFTHPGASVSHAASYANKLVKKGRVADRIASERKRLAQQHEMTRDQLLGEFLAIVRADPNELTQIRCVACSSCWASDPDERKGRWVDPEPDCADCMGEGQAVPWFADTRKLSPEALALYAGVKLTKDGATILQHDKMAALVNIGKILGAYEKDNEQKRPEVTEQLAQLVSELHGQGTGRLKFAPRAAATQPKVQH